MSIQPPFQEAAQKRVYTEENFVAVMNAMGNGNLYELQRVIEELGASILTAPMPAMVNFNGPLKFAHGYSPNVPPIVYAGKCPEAMFEYALSMEDLDQATGIKMAKAAADSPWAKRIKRVAEKFSLTPQDLGVVLSECARGWKHKDAVRDLLQLNANPRMTFERALAEDCVMHIVGDKFKHARVNYLADGLTPTIVGAVDGNSRTLTGVLLTMGADMFAHDAQGRNARGIAYGRQDKQMLSMMNTHLSEQTAPKDFADLLNAVHKDDVPEIGRVLHRIGDGILRIEPPQLQGSANIQANIYTLQENMAVQIVKKCSTAAFEVLLNSFPDRELCDRYLEGAINSRDPQKLSVLLQNYAFDQKILGEKMATAYRQTPDHPLVPVFLAAGAECGATLAAAITHYDVAALDKLIKAGAKVNSMIACEVTRDGKKVQGYYPVLTHACAHGTPDQARCLLKAGARPDIPSSEGAFPLEAARNEETRQMLIKEMTNIAVNALPAIPAVTPVVLAAKTIKFNL